MRHEMLQEAVEIIRSLWAGNGHDIALIQVGADSQEEFISWAASELLPALRSS